jgi:glutamyl-tRNA synthetase
MRELPLETRVDLVRPYLERAVLVSGGEEPAASIAAIVAAAGDRIKVAGDVLDYDYFFQADSALVFAEPEFERALRTAPRSLQLLDAFAITLADVAAFEPGALEGDFRAFLSAQGAKPQDLVNALRVAITGKGVGFGLFETMAILGKDRCLARIHRALERAHSAAPSALTPTRSEG